MKKKRRPDRPKWKLIWFLNGSRSEKLISDPRVGARALVRLRRQNIRCVLASRVKPFWPPEDDDMSLLNKGMMWCPYCRAWRWFKPTKTVWPYAKVGRWICHYCLISENDFNVRMMNDTWGQLPHGRRRRSRRRRKVSG